MDHSGNVWIGTSQDGVCKFDGENWTTYDTSNSGLADDSINAITIDHSGNVWIGTSIDGVSKFDGATWTTYDTSNSGLVSNHVRSIAIDSADVKWFGGCLGGEWSPGVFIWVQLLLSPEGSQVSP
jgi:ligand-binding sensor domain-containing protein